MTVTIYDDEDRELIVTGDYSPYHPGTMYRRNGDPGDPPEPAEFSISQVLSDGSDITAECDLVDLELRCLEEITEEEDCEEDSDITD